MYIPPSFQITDAKKLAAFMELYSFATLVTFDGECPFASHLPVRHFVNDGHGVLVSHMARANPQWRHFSSKQEVLVMFQGPHSYISPTWYSSEPAVPTWNYAAVHAYGIPKAVEDHERIVSLLAETIEFFERSFAKPWPGILPQQFRDQLIHAIVAFEIQVTRVEGKFKLGQNRSSDDVRSVYDSLAVSNVPGRRELASFMASEDLLGEENPT